MRESPSEGANWYVLSNRHTEAAHGFFMFEGAVPDEYGWMGEPRDRSRCGREISLDSSGLYDGVVVQAFRR